MGGGSNEVPLLALRGVSKKFGALQALDSVDFKVSSGEVVALLGDNGAGKSTLIKILAGSLAPDQGEMWFDGEPVVLQKPAQAKALGIETVYQDLSLCPNVDCVANFFMGRELTKRVMGIPVLDEARMEKETGDALRDIGAKIPSLRTDVANLSGGQRQAIELCRFVHFGGKLVILDEPFAALGVEQTRRGLELIERVRQQGVAVIVVTHNMLHAFKVASRAVVLRHGQVVGDKTIEESDPDELVHLITGGLS
jgi:D-xylose transport system ATP-binding protein